MEYPLNGATGSVVRLLCRCVSVIYLLAEVLEILECLGNVTVWTVRPDNTAKTSHTVVPTSLRTQQKRHNFDELKNTAAVSLETRGRRRETADFSAISTEDTAVLLCQL